jgi:hypothetical protein
VPAGATGRNNARVWGRGLLLDKAAGEALIRADLGCVLLLEVISANATRGELQSRCFAMKAIITSQCFISYSYMSTRPCLAHLQPCCNSTSNGSGVWLRLRQRWVWERERRMRVRRRRRSVGRAEGGPTRVR